MKIAAAYIRVSTDDQTELSPDSQIKQVREYAKQHDMIIPDEFIFRDDGISGRTTAKRPQFNEMIGTAKKKPKPFDVILLWKFSRFARNREDSIVYKSMLKKLGIDVVSISEPVGDDKMSVLIEAMIEAMDEYYSINLSEEVNRGMLEALSRGRCVNSYPLGYTMIDKQLVVNEDTAPIIRRIYTEFLSGKKMLTIARDLTADGYRTLYGKPFEHRTVEYILRNPIYKGYMRYTPGGNGSKKHYNNVKPLIFKGVHEPIISPEMWDKAAERIQETKKAHQKYCSDTAYKYDLMLRGLLKCSNCGCTLSYSSKGYQCGNYNRGKCSVSHYISENRINKAVVEAIRTLNINDNINIIPPEIAPIQDNTPDLIKREQVKLKRIKEAYLNGIDTIEEYKMNKTKITAEIERLKAQQIKPEPIKPELEKRRIEFNKMFDSGKMSPGELNATLKSFIAYIIYDRPNDKITLFLSP